MKIFINAATAVVGGGAQVAASFIANTLAEPHGHDYIYTISPLVEKQLSVLVNALPAVSLEVIMPSPAKLFRGEQSRRRLYDLENEYRPDIIYSIASPSYLRFRNTPEIARFADGWFTHPSQIVLSRLTRTQALRLFMVLAYKKWALRRVKYFCTQSQVSASGLSHRLDLPLSNVSVIPNANNIIFNSKQEVAAPGHRTDNMTHVFVLAHPYSHKNIDLVPYVAEIIKKEDTKSVRFILTVPRDHATARQVLADAKRLDVDDMIELVGLLSLEECKRWYHLCSVVFLPTLLETFSATYLEAMAMQKPIVTTDLDFAHDICADAAEYFEPLNAKSAANAILNVTNNPTRRADLVENGINRLREYPTPKDQYRLQIAWIEEMAMLYKSNHA